MTKIKENWLSILLAVVVILSMLLSALLWTNSLGYEWFANNDAEKGTTQQTALQSVGDIYLPTQVILTKSDESQQLLYGQKKNLILTLRNDMQKWQLSGFRRVAHDSSTTYMNYLRNDDSIMLSYPDAMATGIFNQTFSQSVDSQCPQIHYERPEGGMFLWGTLPDNIAMPEFVQRCLEKKLAVVPGNAFYVDDSAPCNSFRMNFSAPNSAQIERGVEIMAQVLTEMSGR